MEIPSVSGTTAIASTLDISATGFCLSTQEGMEVGTQLPIHVTLPGTRQDVVTLRVEVLWIKEVQISNSTEYKVGVRILEPVTEHEKKFIRFYAGKLLQFTRK